MKEYSIKIENILDVIYMYFVMKYKHLVYI